MQTDHHLDHNRPDIVVMEKASRVCQIIDVACPFDTRIAENEREKIDHCTRTSKGKYKKMWSCKRVSILFFQLYLGHLGSDQKLHDVGYQGTPKILNLLQRVCLLGTASVDKDPRHLRL